MNGYFTFNGVSSEQFNAVIYDLSVDAAPALEYDEYAVSGKNGLYLLPQNRFPNVRHAYSGLIYENFDENYSALKNHLLSAVGYQTLTDSFHPDEFYQAVFRSELEVTVSGDRNQGKFEIEFERNPERYLTSGTTFIEYTTSGATITNPTRFNSRPVILINGNGRVGIGSYAVTIDASNGNTHIYVDCDLMECYKLVSDVRESRNDLVTITGNDYPVLKPGNSGITFPSTVSRVRIKPRWWRL